MNMSPQGPINTKWNTNFFSGKEPGGIIYMTMMLDDEEFKSDNVYPWSILRKKILGVLGEGIRLTADQVSKKLGCNNSSVETMLKKMVETQDGISAILVDRGYVYFGCEYKN